MNWTREEMSDNTSSKGPGLLLPFFSPWGTRGRAVFERLILKSRSKVGKSVCIRPTLDCKNGGPKIRIFYILPLCR